MKIILAGLAAGLVLAASASGASAQRADDAVGTWRHPENGSLVKMYKCGARLCARIAKITDGQKTDTKNPNPAKRNRPIVGMVIMSANKAGPNKWSGSLYNRADGKTYSGTITVNSRNALSLSGCSLGIFCKSTTWQRVGG